MNQIKYCGRGYHIPHGDFMDLIDTCFGFHETERKFIHLLPKCYREQYRPQDSNYVVIDENDALTAAVGAYDHEIMVCGYCIPCRGIGNVGVHPEHRNRGYMKAAMNQALADMITDGIALSTLGGRRQRYQYFGYDKAGPTYSFSLSHENFRHAFQNVSSNLTVTQITDPNDPLISKIIELNQSKPFVPVRLRSSYLDIATSWHFMLLAITEGERFVGYCLRIGDHISEIQVVHDEEFLCLLRALYDYIGGCFNLTIPVHQASYAAALAPIAENMFLNCAMHFNVLNFRLVTEAFLALKQTYMTVPDGKLSFLIHGFARDERIAISVQNGKPSVEYIPDSEPVDYELSHLEAMEFLYAPICPARDGACDLARIWFPVPIFMFRADEV